VNRRSAGLNKKEARGRKKRGEGGNIIKDIRGTKKKEKDWEKKKRQNLRQLGKKKDGERWNRTLDFWGQRTIKHKKGGKGGKERYQGERHQEEKGGTISGYEKQPVLVGGGKIMVVDWY